MNIRKIGKSWISSIFCSGQMRPRCVKGWWREWKTKTYENLRVSWRRGVAFGEKSRGVKGIIKLSWKNIFFIFSHQDVSIEYDHPFCRLHIVFFSRFCLLPDSQSENLQLFLVKVWLKKDHKIQWMEWVGHFGLSNDPTLKPWGGLQWKIPPSLVMGKSSAKWPPSLNFKQNRSGWVQFMTNLWLCLDITWSSKLLFHHVSYYINPCEVQGNPNDWTQLFKMQVFSASRAPVTQVPFFHHCGK